MQSIDQLFERRWCYFVPRDAFVRGKGYRVSVVFEGQRGHFPTGDQQNAPWFWGMTYDEAEQRAAEKNDELGLSAGDVWAIVSSAGVL